MQYSFGIRKEYLWVPSSEIYNQPDLEDEYTLIPKFSNLEPVQVFGKEDGHFGFPRHADVSISEVDDQTVSGLPIGTRFLGTLRGYQEPVIADFIKALDRGSTDLILEADTGSGKTIMLLYMLSRIGRTALIVVPKTDLVDQWRKNILKFTDITSDRIGIARQNTCEFVGKSIVIGMIHSLCKDRYSQEFKDHFGVLCVDELHKLGAHYFSKVGGMFPAKYRLGATATLYRQDGLDDVFFLHLGHEVIKPRKSIQPVPRVAVHTYYQSSGRIPDWAHDTIPRRGILLSKLADNLGRTKMISQLTARVISSGRQTLVVSERIPQLELIKKILVKFHGVPERAVGMYLGKTSKAERRRVASECDCILATTSMLTLGTDIPTLRGLIFATPQSDVAQAMGRIRRINPELSRPFVVDIVDSVYPEAMRWFNKREKFYQTKGCDVHFITEV